MADDGYLTLTFAADLDGWGDLDVSAAHGGFAGRSSATVHATAVAEFAERLREYPLDPHSPPLLAGGLSDEDHVRIEVRQVTAVGQVGVTVHLREQWPRSVARGQQREGATIEVLSTYEGIRRFADDVATLAAPGPSANGPKTRTARLSSETLA